MPTEDAGKNVNGGGGYGGYSYDNGHSFGDGFVFDGAGTVTVDMLDIMSFLVVVMWVVP